MLVEPCLWVDHLTFEGGEARSEKRISCRRILREKILQRNNSSKNSYIEKNLARHFTTEKPKERTTGCQERRFYHRRFEEKILHKPNSPPPLKNQTVHPLLLNKAARSNRSDLCVIFAVNQVQTGSSRKASFTRSLPSFYIFSAQNFRIPENTRSNPRNILNTSKF